MDEETDDNGSTKQNSTSSNAEMDFHQENTEKDIVFCKFLRTTDVGDSFSVSIETKVAEDHFSCSCTRTGWERCRDQHKLKYMDLLTVYKKQKHDDHQYFYVIEHRILTLDDFQDDRTLIMKQVIDIMRDPKTSTLVELELAKNLGYNDLYGLKLELPKEEVEEYLDDLPLPEVGRKVTVNDDELNSTAECIWNKVTDLKGKLDVELVNHSYYYEITYERRSTKPQKRPVPLYKVPGDSSAPAVKNGSIPDSTTPTGKSNNKGKGVAFQNNDSDEA